MTAKQQIIEKGAGMLKRLLMILTIILFAPVMVQAGVFWDDTFENHLYPNWTYASDAASCVSSNNLDASGCNPGLSTDIAHSGSYSLKGVYTGPNSGTYMDRSFPASTDLWERVWVYFSNFSAIQCPNSGCAGTKNILNLGPASYPGFSNWWMFSYNGAQQYFAEIQTPAYLPGDTDVKSENINTYNWRTNVWTCLEMHTHVNDIGSSNGVIEMWVDGVQVLSYSGLNLTSTAGGLNTTRHYVQHGLGTIYWDDHAVGNTRIGCATVQADITPPAIPTGLSIR
ncbi:MAG TPA: heparin lyase I family protein [Nitrospira sp.]|nr:heparin lyase I family protein [Nitrospira sp.]